MLLVTHQLLKREEQELKAKRKLEAEKKLKN